MTRAQPPRSGRLPAAAAAALVGVLVLSPALALPPAPLDSVGVWLQTQRVLPADASEPSCFGPSMAFQKFGFSIATDGDALAVGMRGSGNRGECTGPGAVYVFERGAGGWQQTVELDGHTYELGGFGVAVALDGDVLVVGAPYARFRGPTDHGAAFIFERSGDDWALAARLTDPGTPGDWDYFGMEVAVSGDVVAVGAPGDDLPVGVNAGSVFLYQRTSSGWELADHLTGTSRSDVFGWALAFDAGTLLVGAPNGRYVHSFALLDGAWAVVDQLLPASTPVTFGHDLALDGDVAVVGAAGDRRVAGQQLPCQDLGVVHTCGIGSALIFERGPDGWSLVADLENPTHGPGEFFGYEVAVGGGIAVVGAPHAEPRGKGAAYVYESLPDGWGLTAALLGDDTTPGVTDLGDWFGWAVAVADATVFASAILDDNRGDGSPPPLDDFGNVPPCLLPGVVWGCSDGKDAGTVYAFEKLALPGVGRKE